jgi:Alginate export
MPSSSVRLLSALLVLILAEALAPRAAEAQAAAPAASAPPPVTFFARNLTRVEMWSFFTPPPGGGDPDYAHIGNRLFFGVEGRRPRIDYTVGLQYVQFGGLPDGAIGPGPLGTGGAYFQHAGRSDSRQLYLRALNVRVKQVLPGLDVQIGRMGYASGGEGVSGVPKIEAVKRQRLDSRLVGEFEWSIYQRAYDGLRADWTRGPARVTASALRPTQGGFEDAAGVSMDDLTIVNGAGTFRPGSPVPGAEWQLFAHYYDDSRQVSGRPDNSGRAASRADVQVGTFGTSIVGAYAVPSGQVDVLGWLAVQNGSWYDQSHRAWSAALEAGHQWTDVPWQPWARGGLLFASGDDHPADGRHGTFFQMLPTVRRYSMTTAYSQMNLNDRFAQVMLRPSTRLSLRGDVHWLSLAEGTDRWYYGSGATQEEGTIFGFATRPSGGATGLGTAIEGSADVTVNRHFSVNGYVGHIRGGDVVRRSFAGDSLTFGYVETQIRF